MSTQVTELSLLEEEVIDDDFDEMSTLKVILIFNFVLEKTVRHKDQDDAKRSVRVHSQF